MGRDHLLRCGALRGHTECSRSKITVLLVVTLLCYGSCKARSDCERERAETYLDAAIDMIGKAKHNFPERVRQEKSLTREALDCSELLQMGYNKSGVYKIWPVNRITENKTLEVYCDMQTDGGGWTLIQRRGDFQRAVDYFYQDWETYKKGFGDIEKDFWLGNDYIFALSNQRDYSARFDLTDMANHTRYAQYDKFWIDDENHKYKLHIFGYSGNAGESMAGHNNQKFSTKDQDNDNKIDGSCGELYKGGWWYYQCHSSNLNGLYLKAENDAKGVIWHSWKKFESMKSTEIKIRPKIFALSQASLNTPK